VVAFARARGPLQTALNSLPRQGAAATLEALSVALDWRTVLAASPDPDAVTHLDLALDWLRDLEASGVSVREMVERLGTEDDPPRLNLDRPAPAVSCMTVFGAKGLAWDHVLVASVGKHASSASAKSLGLDVGGQTLQLLPLRLDPDGALDPKHDPHGALSKLIQRQRQHEECVRLAYVGLTRARETAWCALPPASSNAVVAALVDAWGPGDPDATPEQAPAGVTWLPYTPAPGADAPSPQRVVATGSPMPPAPVAPAPWRLRSPSSLHTHSGPARRAALVESVLTRVIATGSHHAGLDDFLESPARFAEAGAARSLGDIAHAWLAAWSFDAVSPTNERAVQFLRDEWAMEDAETAAWLIQLSDRIRRDADNPLLARVHSEGVQRFAEWPLLAPASVGGSSPLLLNGTADLVLRDPGAPPAERWTILDFKAGKAPDLTPGFDRAVAARDAKLKTYAPQLEGYREALEAAIQTRPEWAGEGVGAVGLWFVRRGAALWWSQTQPASSPSQPPSAS
jgi:ATP-dependent exoDNAse (exonuclease V) beta subunit